MSGRGDGASSLTSLLAQSSTSKADKWGVKAHCDVNQNCMEDLTATGRMGSREFSPAFQSRPLVCGTSAVLRHNLVLFLLCLTLWGTCCTERTMFSVVVVTEEGQQWVFGDSRVWERGLKNLWRPMLRGESQAWCAPCPRCPPEAGASCPAMSLGLLTEQLSCLKPGIVPVSCQQFDLSGPLWGQQFSCYYFLPRVTEYLVMGEWNKESSVGFQQESTKQSHWGLLKLRKISLYYSAVTCAWLLLIFSTCIVYIPEIFRMVLVMSKGRKKVLQNIYWFSCIYAELYHTFLSCAKKKILKKK